MKTPTLRQLLSRQRDQIEDQSVKIEELSETNQWLRQAVSRLTREAEENHADAANAHNVAMDVWMKFEEFFPRFETVEEISWATAPGIERRVNAFERRLNLLPDATADIRAFRSMLLRFDGTLIEHADALVGLATAQREHIDRMMFIGEALERIETALRQRDAEQTRVEQLMRNLLGLCHRVMVTSWRALPADERAQAEAEYQRDLASGKAQRSD